MNFTEDIRLGELAALRCDCRSGIFRRCVHLFVPLIAVESHFFRSQLFLPSILKVDDFIVRC
jgi:hypothetical protein